MIKDQSTFCSHIIASSLAKQTITHFIFGPWGSALRLASLCDGRVLANGFLVSSRLRKEVEYGVDR